MPRPPWSSYRKSVQYRAPASRRPKPIVRGNASGNGQPAGAGSAGSGRSAAAGTPSGRPLSGGATGATPRAGTGPEKERPADRASALAAATSPQRRLDPTEG